MNQVSVFSPRAPYLLTAHPRNVQQEGRSTSSIEVLGISRLPDDLLQPFEPFINMTNVQRSPDLRDTSTETRSRTDELSGSGNQNGDMSGPRTGKTSGLRKRLSLYDPSMILENTGSVGGRS